MKILKANIEDAVELTALTIKSKSYWGFSTAQLDIWKLELTISSNYIEQNAVYKLVVNQKLIAYYSYIVISAEKVVLDNLFVLPMAIGKGYGKLLMNDFLRRVKLAGISKITLESEPKVETFYFKFGFHTIQKKESSIVGRYLAVMNKKMEQ